MSMNPYGTAAQTQGLAQQRRDREEREDEAVRAQQQRDDENAKLRAARLQAIDDRKAAERAERLAAKDREFIEKLRQRYLASDPLATVEDFERELPELRRRHRMDAALNGPTEQELAAQRTNASRYF